MKCKALSEQSMGTQAMTPLSKAGLKPNLPLQLPSGFNGFQSIRLLLQSVRLLLLDGT